MALSFDPIAEARRNWETHGWGSADAMVAATSITRAHQILLGRIDAALAPLGLNFSRFEAIALLCFTRAGELPLGKMGDRLQVHPTSITNTIDRLESDGLVSRVPHPTDRRTTLARLTEEGRAVADRAQQALAAIHFGFDGLDAASLNRIDADIRELRHQAGDF
ncbi:MAG: MarR family winged helix-turn-helix transcriptional regulator [Acidimicrobiales bacterium]